MIQIIQKATSANTRFCSMQHLCVNVQTEFPYSIETIRLPTVLTSVGKKRMDEVNSVVSEFQVQ